MDFIDRLSEKMDSVTSLNLTIAEITVFEFTRIDNTPFRAPRWCLEPSLWHQWDTSNITSLTLNCVMHEIPSLECVREILAGCQSTLMHLTFEGPVPAPSSTPLLPVPLPALKLLRIFYSNEISGLVNLIHAPDLGALELHDTCMLEFPNMGSTDEVALLDALRPSCANLVILTITGLVGCPIAHIDTFYQQMPCLLRFFLFSAGPQYEDALFQTTARDEGGPVVFPQLVQLAITHTCPVGLATLLTRHNAVPGLFALLDLQISSRQWGEAYLSGSPLVAVLNRAVEGGMKVTLVHEEGLMDDLD
ncbi:hypothetical protein B0H17DRAFT_1080887 [Mycena rosella]|uniref:Uncharacterized protein n=1 Tax=Mycena rosella TaxID=1033263 RepID=A0AAD7D2F9_MYCRO|nr:hypothetical protein B0H17DRAFT_1080887 [Mycena rosella]